MAKSTYVTIITLISKKINNKKQISFIIYYIYTM